jgi:drug/metabolite transporter (DMT)-like permease
MHAIWNALVKVDDDRLMTMVVVIGTTGLLAPFLLLLGPSPALESWPYIFASVILNNIYFLFLIEAYRVGDFSHAYPLARGSAPLMVALGAMFFGGEFLGLGEIFGIVLVCGGIISLMWGGGLRLGWAPIVYPLLTGFMIATYTIIDGVGVRLSGSPFGYIGWLFILSPFPLCVIALARRGTGVLSFLRTRWRRGVIGGFLNMASYGIAIWALAFTTMAHVSALRETSVVIAALIGSRVLGEALGRKRLISAIIVFVGVVSINLSAAQ